MPRTRTKSCRVAVDSDEAKMDPLQRPELHILLEEAARHAPQLLPVLAEQLEQRGGAENDGDGQNTSQE